MRTESRAVNRTESKSHRTGVQCPRILSGNVCVNKVAQIHCSSLLAVCIGENSSLPICLLLLHFTYNLLSSFLSPFFFPSLPSTSLPFPCWPSSLSLSHLTMEFPYPGPHRQLRWYGGSHTLKTFLAQVLKASSCPQSSSPSLIFRILSPPSSSRRVSTACPKAQK